MVKKKPNFDLYDKFRAPKVYNGNSFGVRKKEQRLILSPLIIKLFLFFLALVAVLVFLFQSPKFAIREVMISGNNLVSKEEILNQIPAGSNIFLLNTGDTEAAILRKLSEIDNVQVYRGIPDALKIVIFEKQIRAVWQSQDTKYLLSSQGEVTRAVLEADSKLPLIIDKSNIAITPGTKIVSANFIAFILNIFNSLKEQANINPQYFDVSETTFDVNLYTDAGFYIKLNSLRSSKKQLENLKKVLVEKRPDIHEYIDLRIDGWAYYR